MYETFTNQDEAILNSWSELKNNYILRSITIKYKKAIIVIFQIYFADMKKIKVWKHTESYPSYFLKINFNKLVPGYE